MMLSTHTIYTLQTEKGRDEAVVQIETLVTKGLYRFTLLGMSTRHASDTKDRVYSALRSNELLNLKSDNRKIIVNLSPDETLKREGVYDLGIALSLIACVQKDIEIYSVIAVGGLTLSGKITASKRILQTIYAAHTYNIETIVCGEEDALHITTDEKDLLSVYGIKIISATTIKELVDTLKKRNRDKTSAKLKPIRESKIKDSHIIFSDFEKLNSLQRTLLISLCGGHHLLIQSPTSNTSISFYSKLFHQISKRSFGEKVYSAFINKLLDSEYIEPIEIIENVKLSTRNIVQNSILDKTKVVIGRYTPCTCGHSYVFFEANKDEEKCICSKKLILLHKRNIKSHYYDLFSMHLIYPEKMVDFEFEYVQIIKTLRRKQFERYVIEHRLNPKEMYMFPEYSYLNEYRDTTSIEKDLNTDALLIWKESGQSTKALQIARTIQDIMDLDDRQSNKKPAICKQAIVLAISYLPRMDS